MKDCKGECQEFDNQPAITHVGDSKKTFISFKDKKIEIKCLLSNTKVCRWNKEHSESHNHYIVTVRYGCESLSFSWFDSLANFINNVIDKNRKEIIEMFYFFLSNIVYKNEYLNKDDFCQKEEGHTPALWNTLCRHENSYNRVFKDTDIYELSEYLGEYIETYEE